MAGLRSRLDGVLVVTRGEHLDRVTPPELPSGCTIRDLDPNRPADVDAWLSVHNPALGHGWGPDDFRREVVDHRRVDVHTTYLLLEGDDPVGVASVGVFRVNPTVGVGHWLSVRPDRQGRGLGRLLTAHRYHQLAGEGIEVAESQTHLARRGSLAIHFGLGFRPKYRLDPWNNAPPPLALRLQADARLWACFRRWRWNAGRSR
jgi:GNAT superfamily N-acetyltransferase